MSIDGAATELKELGLIKISGPDSFIFLQGQLTCDISKVTTHQGALGAYCNIKGRVLASFYIFFQNGDYYLLLNQSLAPFLIQDLGKYAAFHKVVLTIVTDLTVTGWFKHDLALPLSKKLVSSEPYTLHHHQDTTILTLPGPTQRFIGLHADSTLLSSQVMKEAHITWTRATIHSGIVLIVPEVRALFTPHQLNYHNIGAISFNKGCYIGQEIVARTHYLGRVSQQLYRFKLSAPISPLPGSDLEDQKGNLQGTCVAGMATFETHAQQRNYEGLAVLRNESIKNPLFYKGHKLKEIESV